MLVETWVVKCPSATIMDEVDTFSCSTSDEIAFMLLVVPVSPLWYFGVR